MTDNTQTENEVETTTPAGTDVTSTPAQEDTSSDTAEVSVPAPLEGAVVEPSQDDVANDNGTEAAPDSSVA